MTSTWRIAASAAVGLAVAALAACDSAAALASDAQGSSASHSGTASVAATVPQPTDVPKVCATKNGKQFTIGVVDIDAETAFFTQMNTGIETVAKKAGATVKLVNGNDDAATQVNGIENLTTAGVNALIVDPYNATALIPALKAAKAAGIAVVATDGTVANPSAVDTWVGTANVPGGEELGKAFLNLTSGKGTIGIVGALNSAIQIQRQQGFVNTVEAGGMKIGQVVNGENVDDTAQTAAENLLTANPNLKYIYATGSPALDGAIAAVRSQGQTGSVSLVGWDLDPTSAAAIQQGFVKEVIQQNTYGFGYAAAAAAIRLACGAKNIPSTISVPIHIVTKQNLPQFQYYLKAAS